MRELLRTHGNQAAWAALFVLVSGFLILEALQWAHPEWFCGPITPGGAEFICGGSYMAPAISLAGPALGIVSLALYALGMMSIPFGGTRWGGRLVLIVLTAFIVAMAWTVATHWNDCFP